MPKRAAVLVAGPWVWFLVRDRLVVLDAVAIVLPVLVVLAVVSASVSAVRHRRAGWLIGVVSSWAFFGLVAVVVPLLPTASTAAPSEPIRLVAANTLGTNMRAGAVAADILAADPDIVVASERTDAVFSQLQPGFEHIARATAEADIDVYSRFPLDQWSPPTAELGDYGLRARVRAPTGDFVLYAMHLPRPGLTARAGYQATLAGQRALVADLRRAIEAEQLPVVVAGDLNLNDRSWGYRRLDGAGLSDAMRSGLAGPTSGKPWWKPLLLRLDHLLVDDDWCVDDAYRIDLAGSDHRAVTAAIGPCP